MSETTTPSTTPPPTPAPGAHAPDAHAPGEHHQHIAPMWILVAVIITLVFLTVTTVGVAVVTPNVGVAMLIATIKASLVALFFMHLYWDKPFNSIVLLISLGLLGLFLWFATLDTGQYQRSVNLQYTIDGMKKAQQELGQH
jgi:cytochrome c oxidase subunit 4